MRPSEFLDEQRLIYIWSCKRAFAKSPLQTKANFKNRRLLEPLWNWIYVVGHSMPSAGGDMVQH